MPKSFQQPMILYGFHAVESAIIHNHASIRQVWIEEHRRDKRIQKLISLMEKYHIAHERVSRSFLKERARTDKHQGVTAEYIDDTASNKSRLPAGRAGLSKILEKKDVFLLILDGIKDPHNLGACLRSANAAGVDAVIAPKDRAVGLTPTVRKIASGAAENTPFIQVTNLADTLRTLKDADVQCIGMAQEASDTIYEADLTGRLAIVVGSEGKGLRRLTRENCDALVKIPMNAEGAERSERTEGTERSDVESLNVSVATGIALFEALRQRHNLKK